MSKFIFSAVLILIPHVFQDLAVASPATVSRCGMVYIDPGELGWRPYVKTWLATNMAERVKEETRNFILDLFDAYVEDGLRCPQRLFSEIVLLLFSRNRVQSK